MNRLLLVGVLLLICLSLVVASAGSLEVDGGTIQVFQYTVSVPDIKTPENEFTKTPTPTLEGENPTETPTPKATSTPATAKPSQTLTKELPASPTTSPTPKNTRPAPTDTPNLPPTPAWDGSKLIFVSATRGSGCENGGQVWIVVENRGAGALGGPVEWELHLSSERIYSGTIQSLGAGESILISGPAPAAGVYRFRLWQRPGSPYNPEIWSAQIRFDPAACAPAPEPSPTATPKPPKVEPSPSESPPTDAPPAAEAPPTEAPATEEPAPPADSPGDTPVPSEESPAEAPTDDPTPADPPAGKASESGEPGPDSTEPAP